MLPLAVLLVFGCSDHPTALFDKAEEGSGLPVANAIAITDLRAASGRKYTVVDRGFQVRARPYTDRNYPFASVPHEAKGFTYIQTANNDEEVDASGDFLVFTVDRDAVVYVAYEDGGPLPSWMSEFAATDLDMVIDKSQGNYRHKKTFSLYQKTFSAGQIKLGSNRASGGRADMYSVIVQPGTANPTPPDTATPPDTGTSEHKISVSPKADTLSTLGDTAQLTATVLDSQGNIINDAMVTWTSRDTSVAKVDTKGKVVSTGVGLALITAAYGGSVDSATIYSVTRSSPPAVASVSVSPASASIDVGASVRLSAAAKDASGNLLSGQTFTWASSNPAVATVSSTGAVSGVAAGSATITVISGNKADTASITVVSPSITPDFGAVVRGIRPRGFGQGTYTLVQPASGAKTYYVSPSGSDSNAGTGSAPFRTINKAAQVAVAGDVVTIRAGTYKEAVRVKNAGSASKPIVFQAEDRGTVVLSGGTYNFQPAGWTSGVMRSGPVYVTVRGLIFRDYAPASSDTYSRDRAAVGAIRGWRIEDCLFDRAGYSGLDIRGDSVMVVRTTFQYHHTLALSAYAPTGSALQGIQVTDVVLRGNNTRTDVLTGSASTKVVKLYRTRGAVVDNIESYENNGPGWWFDTDNTHYVVRNSYLHHNRNDAESKSGRGMFIEINWAPGLVENNVFAGNEGAGLDLANSQGVKVTGNLFVGNSRCVALINADRGAAYPLKNIVITGNYCKDWTEASGIHPNGAQITTPDEMNIVADGNVYDPGSISALSWWPGRGWIRTIGDMRTTLGWEKSGRIEPIAWPR